jgi:dienelactone hydrolase
MKNCLLLVCAALALAPRARAEGRAPGTPNTVVVRSGGVELKALSWRPQGRGPFPAILFNHGSGPESERRDGHFERQASALGPVFASHGYVFMFLFRRGAGLSADQGSYSGAVMNDELAAHGQEARNKVQLKLLETDELGDALAGLAFVRALPDVDARRVAVVGASFGGSLTVLVAERDAALRAAVVFACAGKSWLTSPELRARLISAVGHTSVPIFFIHAANDYSVAPAEALGGEMARVGTPHRLKIYPAFGRTADEGHGFVHLSPATWEADVFAFLNEQMVR